MKKVKFVRAMVYIREKGSRKNRLVMPKIQVDQNFDTYPEKVKASIIFTEVSQYYGEEFRDLDSFDIREAYLIDGHLFTPEMGVIN